MLARPDSGRLTHQAPFLPEPLSRACTVSDCHVHGVRIHPPGLIWLFSLVNLPPGYWTIRPAERTLRVEESFLLPYDSNGTIWALVFI